MVKCIQVEDHVCLTGGEDGNVRLWDLRRVEEDDGWGGEGEMVSLSDVAEEDEERTDDGELGSAPNGIKSSKESIPERDGPCVRILEGHSKAVTALYFEDDCLVGPRSSFRIVGFLFTVLFSPSGYRRIG